MELLEKWVEAAAGWIWGPPLLFLVSGGGLIFFILSRGLPFAHFAHSIDVLRGKHDHADDPGQLSHYRALSVALASTIGMGNISGVAIAISVGGPGTIFWMWVSAILGMATKYFTCTLAVIFRGRDSAGVLQGGPMYVIREGLGQKWLPLAWLFCIAGAFGCLPIFNVNQITAATGDILFAGTPTDSLFIRNLLIGTSMVVLTAMVILGGLKRIATIVSALVPFMVVLYFLAVAGILLTYADQVPHYLTLIFTDAFAANFFTGEAAMGGALGGLIILGARRAAFSNEAGLGTAPMAHGAAKTSEPVQEGLVAMLGPVIDTLFVCTLTALAILVTGVWKNVEGLGGVMLTAQAFMAAYPSFGGYLLLICILAFGLSSLFSYSYYGMKCFSFLFGARTTKIYAYSYIFSILLGAVASLSLIVNFIDLMFALMAVPTVLSALLLSPHVVRATNEYFSRRKQ
ncbi:MAG: alanine/glycine:cation symporter family protein [bacterium]